MPLVACGSHVIIKKVVKKISKQILIPENFENSIGESYGKIISVGEECPYKEDIKTNDIILYRNNEGTKIEALGDEFIVLKFDWILGIVVAK